MSDAPTFPLEQGERVLWQGRLAVGAPWPSLGRLASSAVACWAALAVASLVLLTVLRAAALVSLDASTSLAWAGGASGAVALVALITVAASKVVGPVYLPLLWLLATAPCLGGAWLSEVLQHGVVGAIGRPALLALALPGALFVGLPAVIVVMVFLDRLGATCLITDRRLLELSGGGRVVLAERAYTPGARDDLRSERTWRAPAGLLVAGPPAGALRLALRDDDPARILDLVRALRQEPPA